jgi:hypothetical protein
LTIINARDGVHLQSSILRGNPASTYVDASPGTVRLVCGTIFGYQRSVRFGRVEVRPLGGGLGCLLMILFSVLASVALTVLANLLIR